MLPPATPSLPWFAMTISAKEQRCWQGACLPSFHQNAAKATTRTVSSFPRHRHCPCCLHCWRASPRPDGSRPVPGRLMMFRHPHSMAPGWFAVSQISDPSPPECQSGVRCTRGERDMFVLSLRHSCDRRRIFSFFHQIDVRRTQSLVCAQLSHACWCVDLPTVASVGHVYQQAWDKFTSNPRFHRVCLPSPKADSRKGEYFLLLSYIRHPQLPAPSAAQRCARQCLHAHGRRGLSCLLCVPRP